ncbi:membrane protein DedA, SNARE-associated domain [Sinosporangium album]|uniref:Membrane protein DedA, SNARE-associated domain n=1 Tax=Sinosporangium album TaxID=504805 RepID=A0A1G7VGF8_9ACTN|nr:DedA family protein [Sinosporangium album]SDG58895.1 membrane protein DedA, SNARE-associated domain [Sinosporangium album]
MSDAIIGLLREVMSSPWIYVALFAVAFIDGFFPVVPGETAVITAGVFAATGETNLALVIAVAALGAFAGDHFSYFLGRTSGKRLRARAKGKTAKAFDWAEDALAERGGMVLVIARYIPGGRTATTLTMGACGYPRRRFAMFDALATISWGVYSGLIGYFGGMAFEHDPIKGLLLGLGIAVTVAAVTEIVRYVRKKRAKASAVPAETPVLVNSSGSK